jgi:hypothetical protein
MINNRYRLQYPIYKLTKEEASEFVTFVMASYNDIKHYDFTQFFKELFEEAYPHLSYTIAGKYNYQGISVPEFLQVITATKNGEVIIPDEEIDYKWTTEVVFTSRIEYEDNPIYSNWENSGHYNLKFYGNQIKGKHVKRRGNKAYVLQGNRFNRRNRCD